MIRKNNNNSEKLSKYKYVKKWAIIIFIITILFVIYDQVFDDYTLSKKTKEQLTFLRNSTPAYPPPLINFID